MTLRLSAYVSDVYTFDGFKRILSRRDDFKVRLAHNQSVIHYCVCFQLRANSLLHPFRPSTVLAQFFIRLRWTKKTETIRYRRISVTSPLHAFVFPKKNLDTRKVTSRDSIPNGNIFISLSCFRFLSFYVLGASTVVLRVVLHRVK